MAPCCGRHRHSSASEWTPCGAEDAVYACAADTADVAVSFTEKAKSQHKGIQFGWLKAAESGKIVLCAACALAVVTAHAAPLREAATGKQKKMNKRETINDLVMILGAHSKQAPVAQPEEAPSRRLTLTQRDDVPAKASADPLPSLLRAAGHLILRYSFTHSIVVTICRVLLLNAGGDGAKGLGQTAFEHFEGRDVVRFQLSLYLLVPVSVWQALLGPATPRGTPWDVRKKNCIFLLGDRALRGYMGMPRELQSVCTISYDVISAFVDMAKRRRPGHLGAIAVTIYKVFGNRSVSVVNDGAAGRKTQYVCGGATRVDLSGALRDFDELEGTSALEESELADGVLSVVLHDLEGHFKDGLLVSVIPIAAENSELIFALLMQLREKVFRAGGHLVHAGGDGAKANLTAFAAVKATTTGTADTKLADVDMVCKAPFWYGTDFRQHDVKHAEQQAHGTQFRHHACPTAFRLDRVLCDFRGVRDATAALSPAGDVSNSSFMGRPLVEFFPGDVDAASAWHRKFCKLIGPTELQRKDPMATDPSIAAARTAPLLRELEERDARIAGPRRFLELVWLMWCCAGGVCTDGLRITPDANLAQFDAIVGFLDEWKALCDTFGKVANSQRPHGFITVEQYENWKLNRVALQQQIGLARTNGYYPHLVSALPTSAKNESPAHSLMRRVEPAMRVSELGRLAARLVEVSGLCSDYARTWLVVEGGSKNSYAAEEDVSFETRVAAIKDKVTTGQTRWEIKRAQEPRTARKRVEDVGVAATRAEQFAHLRSVCETTALGFGKNRVFRHWAVGRYGGSKVQRSSALEKKLVDPRLFADPNLAGQTSPFHVESFTLVEGALDGTEPTRAAVFECELGAQMVTVRPKKGSIGFYFAVHTGVRSSETHLACSYSALVAACFGKRQNAGFHDNDGVVVVTLLLSGPATFQFVSFIVAKKDANVCRMLVNQKDGIGQTLLDSKF
ncbi:hypothetical protein M885DRAFT_591748, partial [Pelagophyceae sp. CCMP2097]